MVETLEGLQNGTLSATPQDNSLATLAPILQREDGHIDATKIAQEIFNRYRGFQPWPGAYGIFRQKKFTVHQMRVVTDFESQSALPGTLIMADGRLMLACGNATWLEFLEIQLEGKKRVAATDFLNGYALASGERLA